QRAQLDAAEHADGTQGVLVRGVDVVHVVLHLRDDTGEVGNETAEHFGLAHDPQNIFRIFWRTQDLHEDLDRIHVFAQGRDAPGVARDQAQGTQMKLESVIEGYLEHAQQLARIFGEH